MLTYADFFPDLQERYASSVSTTAPDKKAKKSHKDFRNTLMVGRVAMLKGINEKTSDAERTAYIDSVLGANVLANYPVKSWGRNFSTLQEISGMIDGSTGQPQKAKQIFEHVRKTVHTALSGNALDDAEKCELLDSYFGQVIRLGHGAQPIMDYADRRKANPTYEVKDAEYLVELLDAGNVPGKKEYLARTHALKKDAYLALPAESYPLLKDLGLRKEVSFLGNKLKQIGDYFIEEADKGALTLNKDERGDIDARVKSADAFLREYQAHEAITKSTALTSTTLEPMHVLMTGKPDDQGTITRTLLSFEQTPTEGYDTSWIKDDSDTSRFSPNLSQENAGTATSTTRPVTTPRLWEITDDLPLQKKTKAGEERTGASHDTAQAARDVEVYDVDTTASGPKQSAFKKIGNALGQCFPFCH